jgi:hypothetical protein
LQLKLWPHCNDNKRGTIEGATKNTGQGFSNIEMKKKAKLLKK